MQEPIDFSLLVKNMTHARQFLGETHATMRGKMKEQFGGLLKHLDKHLADVKTKVPECYQEFEKEHQRQAQVHQANKSRLAELKKEYADLKKKAAEGKLPKPQGPPEIPIDPNAGKEIRSELLDKFLPDAERPNSISGVAWQNWELDGTWTEGTSEPL